MDNIQIVHITSSVEESFHIYMECTTTIPPALIDTKSEMGHVLRLKNGVIIRCVEEDIAVRFLEGNKVDVVYCHGNRDEEIIDVIMNSVRGL